ncbi:hypothetical protein [Mitsuaria sp. BK037]|uniref:hypothetical protein n=1 Tax=Mitsuaria sp. BK037 TaxID=2587122 RepID=UPI001854B4D4|nr:hypothetical protein [Mitsuaria sp. BK037]MBB3280394.1 hypothetical protein [Mitsuaria sp. BK037]
MFDQSNVKYIKRLVVGSDNPARLCTREETEAQMEELNDCLSGASHPRGTLLAVERSFTLVRIGDHQVVLEWMAYHVGFARKPAPKPPRQASAAAAPAPHDEPAPAAAGASRAGSAAEPGEVTDVPSTDLPSTDVADPA